MRFALVGVCYISEEHARLSGPPHVITRSKDITVNNILHECQDHEHSYLKQYSETLVVYALLILLQQYKYDLK